MIVLLLSCLNSWSQTSKEVSSPTGKVDSLVTVPISFIKDANAKLIERKYLIEVNAQKDSVINLNKEYRVEQERIIKDFQGRVFTLNQVNANLVKQVESEKKKSIIFKGVTAGAIVVAILSFITK